MTTSTRLFFYDQPPTRLVSIKILVLRRSRYYYVRDLFGIQKLKRNLCDCSDSDSSQSFYMELFAKEINVWKPFFIFAKVSVLGAWLDSEFGSVNNAKFWMSLFNRWIVKFKHIFQDMTINAFKVPWSYP